MPLAGKQAQAEKYSQGIPNTPVMRILKILFRSGWSDISKRLASTFMGFFYDPHPHPHPRPGLASWVCDVHTIRKGPTLGFSYSGLLSSMT